MHIVSDLIGLRDASQLLVEAITQLRRDRQLARIVKELEKKLALGFIRQGELFLARLEEVKGTYPQMEVRRPNEFAEWWWDYIQWEAMLNWAMSRTAVALIKPVDEAVLAAFFMGGHAAIADVGIPMSFTLANPRAVAYLENYGARLVTNIDGSTRGYIRDVLVKGRGEGWGYDKMAKAITDRYADFAVGRPQEHIRSRAHLIAVNETAEAYGEGNLQVALEMQERGMIMEKHWGMSPDEKTCEMCLGNAAVGWILVEQTFPSGHQRETAHPACRCNTQYRRRKGLDIQQNL